MAALLVYKIPGWFREHEEEQRVLRSYERERQVQAISPEELARRCGKLTNDYTGEDKLERDVTLEMTSPYSHNKNEKVTVAYMNEAVEGDPPKWKLTTIDIWHTYKLDELDTMLGLYPCLLEPSAQIMRGFGPGNNAATQEGGKQEMPTSFPGALSMLQDSRTQRTTAQWWCRGRCPKAG